MEQVESIFNKHLKAITSEVEQALPKDNITVRERDLNQALLSVLNELTYKNKDSMRSELAHFIIDSYDDIILGEKVLQLVVQPKKNKKLK
jgi:hypothetical protein